MKILNIYFILQVNANRDNTLFRQDTNEIHPIRIRNKRAANKFVMESLSDDLLNEGSSHSSFFHHRAARKEANPESYVPHRRVPRQYPHYSLYDYAPNPNAESSSIYRRDKDIYGPPRRKFSPYEDDGDDEVIVPESQRFFPSFPQGRLFAPPPRRGRGSSSSFSRRRPSFRGFGPHEAFASYNFNDYGPLDNSLLGSGNFEVIKGGTFYDNDDPHLNHNPYDPYLDNSYVVFPHSGNDHHHNHVDDFFSNFRDFSEFATRRSGNDFYDEGGYASEHVPQISSSDHDMMTSETSQDNNSTFIKKYLILSMNKTSSIKHPIFIDKENNKHFSLVNKDLTIEKLKPKQLKKYKFIKNNSPKNLKSLKQSKKQPKNIQDVLAQIDSLQDTGKKSLTNEEDPLIAMY